MPAIGYRFISLLAYNPIKNFLYGASRNRQAILKSRDGVGGAVVVIQRHEWQAVTQESTVVMATEVPFVPISKQMSDTTPLTPLIQEDAKGNKWGGK